MFCFCIRRAKYTNHAAEKPYCTHIDMIDKKAAPWNKPITRNSEVGSNMTPKSDNIANPPTSGCGFILPSYNGRLKNVSCNAAIDWNNISIPHRPTSEVTTANHPLRPGRAYANANGAPKQK